jgi:hypothetical protein
LIHLTFAGEFRLIEAAFYFTKYSFPVTGESIKRPESKKTGGDNVIA